ncbi:SDR family NAD(P)-dependent oxidoreductase [Psychromarinibacter halotolerans]|uniref:SDR family NAD(P)-dependent oxidoreductase n=1 Tax=Psychromarinibacter halotolerans TaxID=1775175 RepID=A0ABV7GRK7_9RHOB|nr:SDR family NAD(P)-dependent oxidoreductase [Psychromarinibacter halotolerans]MDF0595361.1 SDR family NAD(P)-dependent oxidoreductase [Psychromarinibacter halotolerans]
MPDTEPDTGPFRGKTWWIVGASEGLGRAVAEALDAKGARLILSARSEDRLNDLAAGLTDARALPLDVTDPDAAQAAVLAAGDFDGIIFGAGFYEPVKATDWNAGAVRKMAQVNFIGCVNVLGAVVPALLRRGRGRIVLIGSLSGFAGLPGAVGYGASKAAVMHLAENLRADLKDTGVTVQRVNPGFIRTRLTDKNDFRMPQIMEPDAAAQEVLKGIRSNRFSHSFPKPFAWLFTVGRHLPLSWFQKIFT